MRHSTRTFLVFLAVVSVQLISGENQLIRAQGQQLIFSTIGDVPYGSSEVPEFQGYMDSHNLYSPAEFLVHVGDIKSGGGSCDEYHYQQMRDMLKTLAVPAYIIPGDNEWNDCSDPSQAWSYWTTHLFEIENCFCATPTTERQAIRPENFAFVSKGVLFIGVNLVSGGLSGGEEDQRLQENADWVEQQFQDKGVQVRAAVVFGHAPPNSGRAIFFDQLEASSATLGKPVLFICGNDHSFKLGNPFSEPNMLRLQVDNGGAAPPVQVTVTMDVTSPQTAFLVEQDPWPTSAPLYNAPPCVNAGADTSILQTDILALQGSATDDGVPTSPGTLTYNWAQVSGSGAATFVDPTAATTTATFTQGGTYLLSLTADDGELNSSDTLSVMVQPVGPALTIDDVQVVEGNLGQVVAVFTVTVQDPNGFDVTVDYTTVDSTASGSDPDYQLMSGNLHFSATTTSQTISVLVNGDFVYENDEFFIVKLSNPVNATIPNGSGVGTILNDDLPPLPVVASFSPTSGPCGTEVTLTGQNFVEVNDVDFNGTPASSFVVDSDTQLRAVVPPAATGGPISVANSGGTGTSAQSFAVTYVPMVTALAPSSGPEGTEIVITGYNFTGTNDVAFNGVSALFTFDSDTLLRANVPGGATTGKVAVSNDDGTGESPLDFTVILMPVVSSISPDNGPVGTETTITGSNFTGVTAVSFGGVSTMNFEFDSDSQVRADVPAGAFTGQIGVTNAAGTGFSAGEFTVTSPPMTVVYTPTDDAYVRSDRKTRNYGTSSTVQVRQSSKTYHAYVKFVVSGLTGAVQSARVRLLVDDEGDAGSSIYLVSNEYAGSTAPWDESDLIWNNAPVIGGSALGSVPSASPGTLVEFDVSGAVPGNGIYSFGITSTSDARVKYSSKEGERAPELELEVLTIPVPVISSFSPGTGVVGSEVTLLGINFTGATDASFNGTSAAFTPVSDTELRAFVPAGASTGKISVTNLHGTGESGGNFTILLPPSISSFSPTSGPVGVEVTISGSNLTGASVAFSGTPATNVTVDNENQVRATVPNGAETGKITVTTLGGLSTSSSDFTVALPPPPTIAGFSPASGPPGTEVTVSGSNFTGVTAVSFGGTAASSYAVDSDGQLRATVAAGSATGAILVTTASGSGSSSGAFSVTAPPSSVSFTATEDAHVKLSRPTRNYGGESSLKVRESTSSYHSYLKFTVSGLVGVVQSARVRLVVVDPGPDGGSIYTVSNDYEGTSTPWLEDGLTWNNAPVISGTALSSTGAVSNGDTVEFDVTGAITAEGTYSFGIQSSSSDRMGYSSKEGNSPPELIAEISTTPPPAPSISGISPTSGPVGTEVTITGSNLTGASVSFNGTSATNVTVDNDSQVRAEVPLGATTGSIAVTTLGGTATSATDFTVTLPPAPTISGFTPTIGIVGTEVIITGSGFIGVSEVTFAGVAASFEVDSTNQLRAPVPGGATTGRIRVTAAGGEIESAAEFEVTASPTTLTFTPTDDSFGKSSSPTKNYGDDEELRVRKSSRIEQTYLKFNVSGVVGSALSARVRLLVTSGSDEGGSIYLVSNNYQGTSTAWIEGGLYWNNAPQITGTALSSLGVVDKGDTVEFDVTAAISGDGIYSFGIASNSSDAVKFHSKDSGVHVPELVIQTSGALSKTSTLPLDVAEAGSDRVSTPRPEGVILGANYPNPFNSETTIEYALPLDGHVLMIVYDVLGRRTRVLIDEAQAAGFKRVTWDGRGDDGHEASSGVYFIRMEVDRKLFTQRITLQK